MNLDVNHRFVPTNSITLHLTEAGPPDGPLVILLHGFPEFWRGWIHQIPVLAQAGYRLWIPDQRGYNLSDKPKGIKAYHIDLLARDVTSLIHAAGEEKAFLIGHDWGAAVAWHLATYYAQHVKRLVVMNVPHPAIMMSTLRKNLSQLRKSWYMFFFQIPGLPEWVLGRNNAQGARDMLLKSAKPDTFHQEDLVHYQEAWKQPGALTAMINWYRSAVRSGLSASARADQTLPRITVPTLLMWGKQDVALGYEMAQPSIELCETGKLVFFEDATHWVQHDQAAKVNQLILEFLSGG